MAEILHKGGTMAFRVCPHLLRFTVTRLMCIYLLDISHPSLKLTYHSLCPRERLRFMLCPCSIPVGVYLVTILLDIPDVRDVSPWNFRECPWLVGVFPKYNFRCVNANVHVWKGNHYHNLPYPPIIIHKYLLGQLFKVLCTLGKQHPTIVSNGPCSALWE